VDNNFAQLPPALDLAGQVQQHRLSRRHLLVQAVAAADNERRELAQFLHDHVIQDLAGVGYALSSLGVHIDVANGPAVERLATIVCRDVELLRAMVRELSPAGPAEPAKIPH
jgi:two-component system NarL family sensor kinase